LGNSIERKTQPTGGKKKISLKGVTPRIETKTRKTFVCRKKPLLSPRRNTSPFRRENVKKNGS